MKCLKTLLILSSLFGVFAANNVLAAPFEGGNAKAGKALVDKHCISCHASSFGGDDSGIYTREYRKVKTSAGLLAQIRNCNTMLDLKWFEDEELNVAAYLNQTYYHFSE